MPGASVAVLPPQAASTPSSRKASLAPERKYKCQFCNRAFSRSEHRSRHERSRRYQSQFSRCRDIAPPSLYSGGFSCIFLVLLGLNFYTCFCGSARHAICTCFFPPSSFFPFACLVISPLSYYGQSNIQTQLTSCRYQRETFQMHEM